MILPKWILAFALMSPYSTTCIAEEPEIVTTARAFGTERIPEKVRLQPEGWCYKYALTEGESPGGGLAKILVSPHSKKSVTLVIFEHDGQPHDGCHCKVIVSMTSNYVPKDVDFEILECRGG